ncbi:MAG: hypothetical protein WBV90_18590, partial [Terrimicrobiaceae bacterium]
MTTHRTPPGDDPPPARPRVRTTASPPTRTDSDAKLRVSSDSSPQRIALMMGVSSGAGSIASVPSAWMERSTARGRAAFYRTLVGPMPNANGRIGEREKGASEKRRGDVHEEDLHDGHAWKDHS